MKSAWLARKSIHRISILQRSQLNMAKSIWLNSCMAYRQNTGVMARKWWRRNHAVWHQLIKRNIIAGGNAVTISAASIIRRRLHRKWLAAAIQTQLKAWRIMAGGISWHGG